ncbi:hypothetical protein [Mycolicibacterium grossiae]|uniref:hypothetical protein n=1 Tax=Mycolicibacterium grossiae TaxID=1552759 RepID=UPI000F774629|nr:hypothetical protein [Mycolicibacterium grossiae]QEM43576.1 hypothetical protein FZ046_01220 [Mycolicibacterium grossiae]
MEAWTGNQRVTHDIEGKTRAGSGLIMNSAGLLHRAEMLAEAADLPDLFDAIAKSENKTLPMSSAIEVLLHGGDYTEEQALVCIDEAIDDGYFVLNERFELVPTTKIA